MAGFPGELSLPEPILNKAAFIGYVLGRRNPSDIGDWWKKIGILRIISLYVLDNAVICEQVMCEIFHWMETKEFRSG